MSCFKPIFGKKIRVTALDECGVPITAGPDVNNAVVITDGFAAVRIASEVESPTEILDKKADGSLCTNERTDASFKYFSLEIDFCGVDTELLSLMTNADAYEVAPGKSGFAVAEGDIRKRFAFEMWTGVSGSSCEPGVEANHGYLLLPFVSAGTVGSIEVDGENSVKFSMTGATTRGGNQWGTGPYPVLEGPDPAGDYLPIALGELDHLLMVQTGKAAPMAPEGGCGSVSVASALTAVSTTPQTAPVDEAAPAPTP